MKTVITLVLFLASFSAVADEYIVTTFPNGVVCYKLKYGTDRSSCVYVPPKQNENLVLP
jgi:hypothetical protein